MAKKHIIAECYVRCDVPEPDHIYKLDERAAERNCTPEQYRQQEWWRRCSSAAKDLARALASLTVGGDVGDPEAVVVEKDICSFCGSEWELDDEGIPCCCQAAIVEWEGE